eukprot:16912-Eustigmatos_ZCMA.PRE.1
MLDWVPFGESEPFRGVLDCSSAAWFYLEKDGGKQAGPVNAGSLAKLFEDGEIDGLTLAWHAGMGTEWKPIAEVTSTMYHLSTTRTVRQPPMMSTVH